MSAHDDESKAQQLANDISTELEDLETQWVPTVKGDASNRALIARLEKRESELTAELKKVRPAWEGDLLRAALASVQERLEDWRGQLGTSEPKPKQA